MQHALYAMVGGGCVGAGRGVAVQAVKRCVWSA